MKAESSVNTASQAEIEPLKDDPRVPQTTPFEMRRLDPDRLPPDYASLMSIFFAVIGLCFQVKFLAWLSFFCVLSIAARRTNSTMDLKQLYVSFIFVVIAIAVNYIPAENYPEWVKTMNDQINEYTY